MSNQLRWQEIATSLIYHQNEMKDLEKEWEKLKENCNHSNLPEHSLGEEYRDTCPDCGYIAYCMEI